ncbi:MAG: peroxiredoxin family protein [Rhodothalassiaceae bacterium]
MRLKSRLLIPMLLSSLALALAGVMLFLTTPAKLAWGGVILAAGAWPGFILYLTGPKAIARTKARLPLTMSLSITGSIVAVLATMVTPSGPAALLCALAGTAIFLWYNFVYSRFGGRDSQTLRLGQPLPDFHLEQADGQAVTRADFLGRKALFLFYRGNWCPLCMAQIEEVAAQYRRLDELGVTVALVSGQPHTQTADLAARFNVPMRFLVDPGLSTARAFDIIAEDGTPSGFKKRFGADTMMPTVVAIDETGTVIWLDQTDNYRVRPEPETFLAAFETQRQAA